ncbi:MAG TPA: DUF4105 domain-containing protein [Elusimicrobiota bacterium]|nr:DUF4105 domain-containing protein [Elusimicrobiota bacterium]
MNGGAGGPRIARPLLFLLLLAAPLARAASSAEESLAKARALKLWDDPEWLRLGHWKTVRGRPVSDATKGFFLSPGARADPRLELEAEVAGLYAAEPGGGVQHPRCRFPARAAWLEELLSLEPKELPPADCSKYESWRELMDASSVTLIFASAYLSNPSSMFGHTFLRLGRSGTGPGQVLRDNTLNFAATTGDDGGVLFALKGLLGLYPGEYTVMPYYMKIQEYNNIDNRDLWEYSLALSSTEVDRLAAHAWEMGQAQFPYYFFSKNCSYQLMPALEAAAPRLNLMPGSPPIVGPVDTLLAVTRSPGLVSGVHYRPSHATAMTSRRKQLTRAERRAAEAYMKGDAGKGDALSAGMPSARRALLLDAAEDYVLYKKGYSPDVPDEVRALERLILIRRARIADATPDPPPPAWAAPPEEGHLRHRLAVGEGAYNGGSFTELAWRPGYHDLLDRPRGFPPGAEIYGFSGRFRYDKDREHFYVRDFRLVEIMSLSPWDSWTRKPSWTEGTGLDTAFEVGKPAYKSLVYEGHFGSGLSAAPWDGAILFTLAQLEGSVGSVYRDGFTAGGALRAGITADLGGHVNALLDGALSARPFGDPTPNHRVRLGFNWAPAQNRALRLDGTIRGPYRELGLYATIYH